jgi:TRAP-type C4-dicarboxylate transport system permease small subunit
VDLSRFINRLAVFCAILGGVVLSLLILMTCLSIVGRALIPVGLAPVPGDFEIVEAGIAFAVFCFIPICQYNVGHATVDIFTARLGLRANRMILAFWETIFALALILITWRLYEGLLGKLKNGETSMILQFPTWWAYLACFIVACVATLVGLWSAYDRIRAVIQGHDTRLVAMGAEH